MKRLLLLFPLLFILCACTSSGPDITTEDLANTFWQGSDYSAFINNLYVIQIDKGDELYFYGQMDEPGQNESNYVFDATALTSRYEDETSKISAQISTDLKVELTQSKLEFTDEDGETVTLDYNTQGNEEDFTKVLDQNINK